MESKERSITWAWERELKLRHWKSVSGSRPERYPTVVYTVLNVYKQPFQTGQRKVRSTSFGAGLSNYDDFIWTQGLCLEQAVIGLSGYIPKLLLLHSSCPTLSRGIVQSVLFWRGSSFPAVPLGTNMISIHIICFLLFPEFSASIPENNVRASTKVAPRVLHTSCLIYSCSSFFLNFFILI